MRSFLLLLTIFFGLSINGQDSLNIQKLGEYKYTSLLNDIWGYADSLGNEYALVGKRNGFSVVDVTNPRNPVEMFNIPGVYSTWRDVKTFSHYAYVVHDLYSGATGDGLLIVDLDSLSSPSYSFFKPLVQADIAQPPVQYDRAHNLWIDENGILYLFGTNVYDRTLMFDLNNSPKNPTYLGFVNSFYHHDGYARNDTLYTGAILNGVLAIYDVRNKSNATLIGQKKTPSSFTHNVWLSDDGNILYTTDEVAAGFIAAYDISNLSNITELDRYQKYPKTDVIPHNTHVYGDYLVTSYYTAGLHVLDTRDPNLMIEVGHYDTSPNFSGPGYNGAWGAYPYLPSKNILVSDMQEGLVVLGPDYKTAGRYAVEVIDAVTTMPIFQATLNSKLLGQVKSTDIYGENRFGGLNFGLEELNISKTGYYPQIRQFQLTDTTFRKFNIALIPEGHVNVGENQFATVKIENPVKNNLIISFSLPLDAPVDVQMIDLQGRVVMSTSIAKGKSRFENTSTLSKGIYILKLQKEGTEVYTQKLSVE